MESRYLKFERPLVEFNSAVWNEKKSKGLSLKDPISVQVPQELTLFAKDLKTMHNLT